MKKIISVALAFLGGVPALSYAEDPPAAAAPAAGPLTLNIGAFTEYRFRGISQTRFKPAIQGGADFALSSGFYIGTWLSNIRWIKDGGTLYNNAASAAGAPTIDVGSANVEWDIYGGYKGEIVKDLTFDVGVLTYVYPGNKLGDIPGAKSANTTEVYGALTFGPATVKYSHAVTTLFGFGSSKNSGYIEAAAIFDLGDGWGIVPHVGYQRVAGTNNGVANSLYSYSDFSLTGTKDFGNGIVVSLAAIGTSTKSVPDSYPYVSPDNKNLGKATAVLGVKYTF
jgi:uncharacterized protein (TIGR02001 family)